MSKDDWLDKLLKDVNLSDADKSFTQADADMAEELFKNSKSLSIFYCTFNNSADGNNPQETE